MRVKTTDTLNIACVSCEAICNQKNWFKQFPDDHLMCLYTLFIVVISDEKLLFQYKPKIEIRSKVQGVLQSDW